jgi:hypothetical protein
MIGQTISHRRVAIVCFLFSMALAQSEGPTLYPVIGGSQSLPLRVVSKSSLANSWSKLSRLPTSPCQSGGTNGNFTTVLSCEGNDSDGTVSYGAVPDTDLAVGDQYYVQTVDNVFTVYNKTDGSVVEGPDPLTTFWNGFQNQSCSTADAGDDFIVRYDKAAARWVVALPIYGDSQGKYWLCLAVSTSSDPTGSYYQYAVQQTTPSNPLWDYPKLGVWTDAYYVGFNMISQKPVYLGPQACALDRTSMLQGLPPAQMQCFSEKAATDSFMLPSDIAGGSEPSAGEPAFFLDIAHSSTGKHSTLNLWQFHVDFTNSQNSTFSGPTALTINSFIEGPGYVAAPDKGLLYTRSDRLMVPLAWRLTADGVEHLLANDAVVSGGATTEQWFDITNPNSSPTVAQQGTLIPDPHDNFWMGSLNMDKDGNTALGFSNASARIDPGIMFTGRLSTDPLDTMEAVQSVITGTGYQSETGYQWGDHSIMAVDPADDCTFWYSNEYYTAANSNTNRWSTRIFAFKFTSCQ